MLRRMNNADLFKLYDSELVLRIHNTRNLENDRRLLTRFRSYLRQYPPSSRLAKGFLGSYTHLKPTPGSSTTRAIEEHLNSMA